MEWLGLCATNTVAMFSRAHEMQQETPPQWEARTLQWRVAPATRNQRKPAHINKNPAQTSAEKQNK